MAGKGNAKDILSLINELMAVEPWKQFFQEYDVSLRLLRPRRIYSVMTSSGFVG